jgi:hypothetical protein
MKVENVRLRLRLTDIQPQMLQVETEFASSSKNALLKEERQRGLTKEKMTS